MARRMRRRDSFLSLSKNKSEDYAREVKEKHEDGDLEPLIILYNNEEKEYVLTDRLEEYIGKSYVNLVGDITWEEVKKNTGRDSVRVGGDYIRIWIDKKVNNEETITMDQREVIPIKVNGENVDTPFRTKYIG